MSITIPLKTLLGLLDHAMQPVEDKKRETIMLDFINFLDSECNMDRKQAYMFLLELRKAPPEMLWIDVSQEHHLPRLGRGVQ